MARLLKCSAAVLSACLALAATVSADVRAADGATLAQIRARGSVRCGVSEGIQGFSVKDGSGQWSGLDVDFCRAVAAAALGDSARVVYVPLRASARFPALYQGSVDLLARNTTWTLLREATLDVQFAGILYYDTQAFLVRRPGGAQSAAGLKGATVCVEKGTSSELHLRQYSADHQLDIQPLSFNSATEARNAFQSERCSAYSADASRLAAVRLEAPGGPQTADILPERIAREPLSPVVRGGDRQWLTLVRWVLFALVTAEEVGVTRDNLQARLADPAVKRALTGDDAIARSLGVEQGWMVRAVRSVGNYGEMFDRNLGPGSPIKLDRGLNRLWTQGGLMIAPPLQ